MKQILFFTFFAFLFLPFPASAITFAECNDSGDDDYVATECDENDSFLGNVTSNGGATIKCCLAPGGRQNPTNTGATTGDGPFDYILLEKIPGASDAAKFPDYVKGIYKFGMWTVGLAALFMITVGGFLYLSSAGNTSAMGTAKRYILDALIGLILAILAWLILNVINPDLVNVNLGKFSEVGGSAPAAPTTTSTPSQSNGKPLANPLPQKLPSNATAYMASQMLDSRTVPGRNITWENAPDCASKDGDITARKNFEETGNGQQMTACHDKCNKTTSLCNGKATMSSHLLTALYGFAAAGNKFEIVSVAGGDHSNDSLHYRGIAIDIDISDRTKFEQVRNAFNAINNKGADPVIAYCDNGKICPCNKATHLHIKSSR